MIKKKYILQKQGYYFPYKKKKRIEKKTKRNKYIYIRSINEMNSISMDLKLNNIYKFKIKIK